MPLSYADQVKWRAKTVYTYSGDDHDYCSTRHSLPPHPSDPSHKHRESEEVTVKSISMAMGIRRPGFQLLSLVSPQGPNPAAQLHSPCVLPDQLGIYMWAYGILGLLSVVGLFMSHVHRIRHPRAQSGRIRSETPTKAEQAEELAEAQIEAEAGEAISLTEIMSPGPRRRADSTPIGPAENFNGIANGHTNGTAEEYFPAISPRTAQRNSDSKRRRFSIPYLSSIFSSREQRSARWERRKSRGLVRGVAHDVGTVAGPPVVAFLGIAWWMFR